MLQIYFYLYSSFRINNIKVSKIKSVLKYIDLISYYYYKIYSSTFKIPTCDKRKSLIQQNLLSIFTYQMNELTSISIKFWYDKTL